MNHIRAALTARTIARRRSGPIATAIAFVASAMIALFSGPASFAAVMYWDTATTIAGDTDVSKVGALSYAYDLSNSTQTVNTVVFTGAKSPTALGTNVTLGSWNTNSVNAYVGTAAPYTGLSAAYKAMLQGGDYTSGATAATVTLNALTSGHQYLTQVWVEDPRAGTTRTETITSTGGNTVTLDYNSTDANGGVGQYTKGIFRASATTQVFTLTGNESTQMNAIQVRDVTNLGYWTGVGGATWDASTTSNFANNLWNAAIANTTFATAKTTLSAVTFADAYWNSSATTAVTQNAITVAAGGVSTGNIYFQNSGVAYTITSSDANGITGTTKVNLMNGGTVSLAGTHSYTGATNIFADSTLQYTGAGGNTGGGSYSIIGAGSALTLNTSGTVAASGVALDRTAAAVLNLTAGTLTVNTGGITNSGTSGSAGVINFAGGTLKSAGVFSIAGSIPININAGGAVIDTTGGNISSSSGFLTGTGGGVTVQGGNTLTLPASNSYTGGTTITGNSTLKLGASTLTGLMTINSGSKLDLINASSSVGGLADAGTVLNTGGTASVKTLTITGTGGNSFSGVIGNGTGTGTDTYTGVVVNLTSGTQTFSGTNTYTGGTTLKGGTLSVGATANLGGAASSLTFNGGTLQITGTTLTNFTGIGHSVSFTAAASVGLDINNAGNTFTVDKVLNQTTGGFTKLGAGTAILNQINTFTGAVAISEGVLSITNSSALGTGTKAIAIRLSG